jgi:phospholipid/cholesterol/gamma-HCH transport system substrate-binding protein
VDKNEIPVIRTEASALQNIADTANKLVTRMDELLSEENIKRISNSLASIEAMTGAVGDQSEDVRAMIVSARSSSEQLEKTLATTDKAVASVDRELVQKLPGLISRLDATLAKLDSAAAASNGIVNDNRAAISSFANDGLASSARRWPSCAPGARPAPHQRAPRQQPTQYLLGRDTPKEFEPQ